MKLHHYDHFDRVIQRCDPDNSNQRQQYLLFLQHASQLLTDWQAKLIRYYYFEGLTMEQIAQRAHRNRSTICRGLQRAKERLKSYAAVAEKCGLFSKSN